MKDVMKSSRILKVFIREGLGYFLAVAAVNLLNVSAQILSTNDFGLKGCL